MPKKLPTLSRSPVFPPSAFFGIITLISGKNTPMMLYPLMKLYTKNADFFDDAKRHQEEVKTDGVTVGDTGIIVPVTFRQEWPLIPEYWNTPTAHYDHIDRSKLISKAILYPEFYSILVTPSGISEKQEEFAVALPVPKNGGEQLLEQFMRTSDFPVDQDASMAAIYDIGEPVGINIVTAEFVRRIPTPKNTNPN